MCCSKCIRLPTLIILGVILTIVLVCITGITLTNIIDISNIIKLREKVASDSAAQNAAHAEKTRAALIEQQYANLQQHHLSRSDLNYIAASHPKNLRRFATLTTTNHVTNMNNQNNNKNKIVIEIGIRNLSEIESTILNSTNVANSKTDDYLIKNQPISKAIVDNNVESISVPAEDSPEMRRFNESLNALLASVTTTKFLTFKTSSIKNNRTTNDTILRNESEITKPTKVDCANKDTTTAEVIIKNLTKTFLKLNNIKYSIADHNPAMIDFEKRNYVRKMMLHSWQNYKLYAWGKNELRPISQRPHLGSVFGSFELGATIVDGLDTLFLMGLEKEYKEGRDWIEHKLSLENVSSDLSVFETNIRFVGGLLTLYAFTGENMYKEKAQSIADKLLPAFQTPTGIPYALVNPKSGMSKNYGWASGGSSILSEFGTLHLEFAYLSDITGNPLYRERVQAIRQVLKEIEKPKGLYPNFLNPKTGKWGQMHMSLGALGDSFYEYLLKAWLQSGQTDEEAREMFDEAMVSIIDRMVRTSNNGLIYVSDMKFDRLEQKMDHLACFSGGLFALGANTRQNQYAQKYMEIGKGITNTCRESYIRTATKLGPESFRFSEAVEARALKSQEKYYILRPETVESYFILWRLTHDQKYRDWGWDVVQALEEHCRTSGGYSGIKNVYQVPSQKDDVQQSFFVAETLKYLYLLFSDDSLLPLDEWVFNTEAHPLPIKGANIYYRPAVTTSMPATNVNAS